MPAASWDCHLRFLDGGPAKAAWHATSLLSLPRDRWGHIASGALKRGCRAQAGEPAAAPARPATGKPVLAEETDALAGKIDRIIRAAP